MKILQAQVKTAEFARAVHCVSVPHGTTLADVLKPETWAHVARSFKPGGRIEVTPESGEWFAELFVRSVADNDLKVAVLREIVFDAPSTPAVPSEPEEYEVNYTKTEKWRVVRKSDKAVVASGLSSKPECEAWLAEHTSTLV